MRELQIKFKTKDQAFSEMEKGLDEGKRYIQSENVIFFESYKAFQRFFFPRISILLAIKNYSPNSIHELSKLVERDVSTLVKDCNALENIGFISFEKTNDPKDLKSPRLKFEYNRIVIHSPTLGSHTIELTA